MGGCYDDFCGLATRIIVYVVATITVALSIYVIFSCDFMRYTTIEAVEQADTPYPFTDSQSGRVGLFHWNQGGTGYLCFSYPENLTFDAWFSGARVTSYISFILAILALFISSLEVFFCQITCSRPLIGMLFFGAFISQGCTFLILAAEEICTESGRSCNLGAGGIISAVAAGLYLLTSIFVCFSPKPKPWLVRFLEDRDKQKEGAVVAAGYVASISSQDVDEENGITESIRDEDAIIAEETSESELDPAEEPATESESSETKSETEVDTDAEPEEESEPTAAEKEQDSEAEGQALHETESEPVENENESEPDKEAGPDTESEALETEQASKKNDSLEQGDSEPQVKAL